MMDAEGPESNVLIADKGHYADRIRDDMEAKGGVAVIPMAGRRKVQVAIDQHICGLRNRVDRCFNKLKNSRRVATRYDKAIEGYTGFLLAASIRLWINQFGNRTYVLNPEPKMSSGPEKFTRLGSAIWISLVERPNQAARLAAYCSTATPGISRPLPLSIS